MSVGIIRVEIFGQNDEYLCVHGRDEGNRGVTMGEDQVAGLWYSPEEQTWKGSARVKGARPKNRRFLQRDMEIGVNIVGTRAHSYEENESYLIQAIGFELDKWDPAAKYARMALTTDLSGVRHLDIVQYDVPEIDDRQDAIMHQYGNPILKIRSGQPDWYELFDGKPYYTTFCEFTSDGWGEIEVENPTNREMEHKWVCTGAPSGEPGVVWTLPDPSWSGPKGKRSPGGKDESRVVVSPPITAVQGGLKVDLDPTKIMARDFYDTNILALFGGRFFTYKIPPYTQKQKLRVHAANVPAGGARVELRQPRMWAQPYGGELIL